MFTAYENDFVLPWECFKYKLVPQPLDLSAIFVQMGIGRDRLSHIFTACYCILMVKMWKKSNATSCKFNLNEFF